MLANHISLPIGNCSEIIQPIQSSQSQTVAKATEVIEKV